MRTNLRTLCLAPRTLCLAAALVFATASAGCGDDDITEEDVDDAIDEGQARGADLSVMAGEELGARDQVTAMSMAAWIMLTIDDGEILQAERMVDRCDEERVCAYADRMLAEHTAHAQMVNDLIVRLNLTPLDNRVADELRDDAIEGANLITSTLDPDLVYMTLQVRQHETAFVVVGDLTLYVEDPGFDPFLRETQTLIGAHSSEAQAILRTL